MAAIDLLILDDLGLHPLRHDEPTDLYELIRVRYETGAIVITSNRDIEEWAPLFGDALLASAAMDRLLHHAHIIDIEGESYRNPRAVPSLDRTEIMRVFAASVNSYDSSRCRLSHCSFC